MILAGCLVSGAALTGCLSEFLPQLLEPAAGEPATPSIDVSACTLPPGSLAAPAGSNMTANMDWQTTDPAHFTTNALLAGTFASSMERWERAYAFCGIVPGTARPDQRTEAAGCLTKAAISMGPDRQICAEALRLQWLSDRSLIGGGLVAAPEPGVDLTVPVEGSDAAE